MTDINTCVFVCLLLAHVGTSSGGGGAAAAAHPVHDEDLGVESLLELFGSDGHGVEETEAPMERMAATCVERDVSGKTKLNRRAEPQKRKHVRAARAASPCVSRRLRLQRRQRRRSPRTAERSSGKRRQRGERQQCLEEDGSPAPRCFSS